MTCPNCGAGLDDRSHFCNYCGQAQRPVPPPPPDQPPPPPGYAYQQPQPPSQGLGGALSGKAHLVLSLCCFGWAGLIGLPRCIRFVFSLASWSWSSFSLPSFSGWFGVGLHFVLPLVAGFVLLNMHRRNINEN